MTFVFKYLVVVSVLLLCYSCTDEEGTAPNNISEDILEIDQFIYDKMNLYYLWNSSMPNLNPKEQSDPVEYFNSLLYHQIDHWSIITDDADALSNYFAGIRKEMGYSLRGYYAYSNSDRVVAFIEYVEPNGPADRAGLRRGDMIVKVNGSELTVDNYNDLFYAETLTIGLGTYVNGLISDLSPSVNLVAEEIQINPILQNKVFEYGGNKVGYLAYNAFINTYDDALIAVFGEFKAAGISDLILDLRYNGGGAVTTAKLMAGMIGPSTLEGQLFIRSAFNNEYTKFIENEYPNEPELFNDVFESYTNNLNLSRLYVLTTRGTASASEMVMYSLMPYMEIIQIGDTTHGKYYGSTTYSDIKNHNWAIQPIIMRAENRDNSIDYSQGLIPNVEVRDDYSYNLGTQEDVLTAIALDHIWGTNMARESLKNAKLNPSIPANQLRKAENPLKYEMIFELQ